MEDTLILVGDKDMIKLILLEMENLSYFPSQKILNTYVLIKMKKFLLEMTVDRVLENGMVLIWQYLKTVVQVFLLILIWVGLTNYQMEY